MCDFCVNWIAWLDGELPSEEAELARQHLKTCSECQNRVDSYGQVTLELNALCNEQVTSAMPRARPRWTLVISAGTVAAVVVLLLLLSRTTAPRHPALPRQEVAASAAPAPSAKPLPLPVHRIEKTRRRQQVAAAPRQVEDASNGPDRHEYAYALPYEPVIEISISADEMFPPGAVPAGMGFAADLAIAADGSPDRLRLQPRLVGFERRTSIP